VSPGNAWLAGYAAIVALCAITVLVRREPTLLRGRTAFAFTALYVALAWAALAWREARVFPFSPFGLGAAALAIMITGIAAPWWFVLGGPRAAVVSTLEVCLGRVCAVYERKDTGFIMQIPAGGMRISVHALPWTRISVVSLRARPPYKKADLLRRLFAKQYRGVLPTPRIRIG
jgi:hypothetical protein